MAYRELELTLLSARDLKNVNLLTRMYVYAVASISGDPMTRQCTPTDTTGGRNPSWNTTFRFAVPPNAAAAGSAWLHVLIRSERSLGDRDIGEVVVPLGELLAGADGPGQQPARLASYQVHTVQRGEPRGVLNVSYHLGPVVAPVEIIADEKPAVLAYPAPQQPLKPQNQEQTPPYQYHHPSYDAYASPRQPYQYQHPSHDAYASPQQNHPSHDAYDFKHQNPATPPQPYYQYHAPHDSYAPSPQQPSKHQNPAAPQPYQHHPSHEAYAQPPQSPANGKSSAHGPTHVYMGPHTQIIFSGSPTPRSNSLPANKPKPSDTPTTQPDTSLVKTDHSWSPKPPTQPNINPIKIDQPSSAPTHPNKTPVKLDHSPSKPSYTPTHPNASPVKLDHSVSKPSYTSTQPNTGPVKTDYSWPKPAYTPTQPNTNPVKTDDHSWPKPSHAPAQPNTSPHSWPKPSHAPTQPNISPAKAFPQPQASPKNPVQQDTRVGVSKIGSGRKPEHSTSFVKEQENTKVVGVGKASAMPQVESRPTENNISGPGKALGPKAALQQERVLSMPKATTR